MAFEHHSRPVISKGKFVIRMLRYTGYSFFLMGSSLGLGILGYHYFNNLNWVDSLLNASMILTGMGPVDPMVSNSAKWFASAYAIFSGVAFLSTVAVFLAPVIHRFLHKLHVDGEAEAS